MKRWAGATLGLAILALLGIAAWWWLVRPASQRPEQGWPTTVSTLATGLADPFGIAVHHDGSLLFTEGGERSSIRRLGPDGVVTTIAGSTSGFADAPGTSARFDTPSGIALDPSGAIYVADTGNSAIRRIGPDGVVSTIADASDGLRGPLGIAVGSDGRVVASDTYNDRVIAIEADGSISTIAGGGRVGFADGRGREAAFDTPAGIAIDGLGRILVADAGNGAVRRISTDGQVETITPAAADPSLRPIGLAVHADGTVLITDDRGRVFTWTAERGLRLLAGSSAGFAEGEAASARFRAPAGVGILGADRTVVADRRNGLLRLIRTGTEGEVRPPAPARPAFDVHSFAIAPILWPFSPYEGPFEITGTLGEPRGAAGSERLHAGLDLHAIEGTTAHAIRAGVVEDPIAAFEFDGLSESLRIGPIAYVHLRVGRDRRDAPFQDARFVFTRNEAGEVTRVRLRRGARFAAGEALGTVNRFYHLHVNIGWPGEEVNPLQFRLPFARDTVRPTIRRGGIRLVDESGSPVMARRRNRLVVDSPVRIVVDAWDQMDGNLPRRRLGLYSAGYGLLRKDGTAVQGLEVRETMRFDRQPVDPSAPRLIYAGGSGIPAYGNRTSRFLYVVTTTYRDGVAVDGVFDPAVLPDGDYTLRILAADIRGNEAVAHRDLPITIVGSGLGPG